MADDKPVNETVETRAGKASSSTAVTKPEDKSTTSTPSEPKYTLAQHVEQAHMIHGEADWVVGLALRKAQLQEDFVTVSAVRKLIDGILEHEVVPAGAEKVGA